MGVDSWGVGRAQRSARSGPVSGGPCVPNGLLRPVEARHPTRTCNGPRPAVRSPQTDLPVHLVHTQVERRAEMAELTTKKRNAEPKSDFGLPGEKKYPMPDKSHARNAKARASQQVKKGNLTASEKKKIDNKADRILDK